MVLEKRILNSTYIEKIKGTQMIVNALGFMH